MEIKPGAVAILHRTFSQRDFDRFAALSGDDNPIHVDPAFAARTRFGRTVCHGMLLYSTICRALTDELGPGFAQQEQELMFVTPTYTGEEVAVRLEVTALWPEQGLADISTLITRPDGSIACQGRTLVALPALIDGCSRVAGSRFQIAGTLVQPAIWNVTLRWLALGQAAEMIRTFSVADLQEYRDLSGDTNPAFSRPVGRRPGVCRCPADCSVVCSRSCWGRGCRAAAPTGSSKGWSSRPRVMPGKRSRPASRSSGCGLRRTSSTCARRARRPAGRWFARERRWCW